ncbi:alpha/beta fold hydrolase [soil metagenome]
MATVIPHLLSSDASAGDRVQGGAARLLVLLHGWSADEHDMAGLGRRLDPDGTWLVVAPRGPVVVGRDRYAWFARDADDEIEPASLRAGLDAVDELIDELCAARHLDRAKAVVGGFSQGAATALVLARRPSPRPRPAGVLCLSGFLAAVDAPDLGLDGEGAADVAVLVQHGTDDDVVPALLGRAVARLCQRTGTPVVHEEHPMGHETSDASRAAAAGWLAAIAAGDRPDRRGSVTADGTP